VKSSVKLKQVVLLLGDTVALYLSLAVSLYLRYFPRVDFTENPPFYEHMPVFSLIFAVTLIIFYIAGFYEIHYFRGALEFFKKLGRTLLVVGGAAIVILYIFSNTLTPKTNLVLFLIVFVFIELFWRRWFNNFLIKGAPLTKVAIAGENILTGELTDYLTKNKQFGYQVTKVMERMGNATPKEVVERLQKDGVGMLLIPTDVKSDDTVARVAYEALLSNIEVADFAIFYEGVFRKVPVDELTKAWLLQKIGGGRTIYEVIKEGMERLLALVLFIILLPIMALVAIAVKLSSTGPVFYHQRRVGFREKEFSLIKFRSMRTDAEKDGAQWSSGKNDARVTAVGRFLRRSHLDELPQLINVLRGEVSLVGPRPERPEFVSELKKEIPYYELRHLVKPGITGWAQINFRYGASVADAKEKLTYDLYYVKNRSFWLDIGTILKTAKLFFINVE